MKPFLSIVIANYNYGRFLDEAIQSVLSQSCQDFELIVIDGGSADNSVEVIQKYANRITYWVSEPDKGQSNAFNKGFAKSEGKFLTWLNADDVMLPGTIEKLKIAVERHPKCEWFVGGCFWLDKNMRIVNCGRGRRFSEIRYREGHVNVWGPSSFFTKRLLTSVGGVDERFRFSMDSDLWQKFAFKLGARYRPFATYAWGLRLHEDAKMSGHNFVNGKFDDSLSQEERLRASKYFQQMKQEEMWMREWFKRKPATRFSRLLSISLWSVLMARIDRLRFRGRHYKEYFR